MQNDNFLNLILDENKCIDNFVKEYDNNLEIKTLWYSICDTSHFVANNLITKPRDIEDTLYGNYQKFIYSLSLINKTIYIRFYEKYFNKTWHEIINRQVYNPKPLSELRYINDSIGYTTDWWTEIMSDFGINNI